MRQRPRRARTSASTRPVRSAARRGPESASTSPRSRSRPACRPATGAGSRRTAPRPWRPPRRRPARVNASASPRRTSSGVRSRFSARIRWFQASGSQGSSPPGYGSTPERAPSITAAEWSAPPLDVGEDVLARPAIHLGCRAQQRVVVHLGGGRLDEGMGLADLAEQRVLVHGVHRRRPGTYPATHARRPPARPRLSAVRCARRSTSAAW